MKRRWLDCSLEMQWCNIALKNKCALHNIKEENEEQ